MASTQELVNMLIKYGSMLNAPGAKPYINDMRKYMDELPDRMGLPKKPSKLFKNEPDRVQDITDMIARYTGVHPARLNSPDPEQLKNAISDYGDTGYRSINKIFRDPFGPSMNLDNNQKAMVMMDSFKPSANDMVLYRGLSPDSKTAGKLKTLDASGGLNEFGNKSFMSTSLDPHVARQFAETPDPKNNFRIMVPAGTPVLPVHGYKSNEYFTPELEYMLPPDSRYMRLPEGQNSFNHILLDENGKQVGPNFSKYDDLDTYYNTLASTMPDAGRMEDWTVSSKPVADSSEYTDLVMTKPGSLKDPSYVPDKPGVGWLAGMLPLGLLDKYSGDQQQ